MVLQFCDVLGDEPSGVVTLSESGALRGATVLIHANYFFTYFCRPLTASTGSFARRTSQAAVAPTGCSLAPLQGTARGRCSREESPTSCIPSWTSTSSTSGRRRSRRSSCSTGSTRWPRSRGRLSKSESRDSRSAWRGSARHRTRSGAVRRRVPSPYHPLSSRPRSRHTPLAAVATALLASPALPADEASGVSPGTVLRDGAIQSAGRFLRVQGHAREDLCALVTGGASVRRPPDSLLRLLRGFPFPVTRHRLDIPSSISAHRLVPSSISFPFLPHLLLFLTFFLPHRQNKCRQLQKEHSSSS